MEIFHALGEIIHWTSSKFFQQFTLETCIITLLVLCALFMLFRNMLVDDILCIPGKSKHNWKSIRILQKACYCNICEVLLSSSSGLFCDCCGLCSCISKLCIKSADRHFKCKEKWFPDLQTKSIGHLWVKGNLPSNICCSHCHNIIEETGLQGWRCAWCFRCYHNACFRFRLQFVNSEAGITTANVSNTTSATSGLSSTSVDNKCISTSSTNFIDTPIENGDGSIRFWRIHYANNSKNIQFPKDICDFGEFRQMIYPPYSIVAARTRESVRLHLVSVKPPPIDNWEPLIVIANTKSGSSTGANVISLLRGFLHPLQVMELSNCGPQEALQWVAKTSPKSCRVLIAGGDGTISWVLNTIYRLNIKPTPSIAILPLGTGNDLSRVLGWGSEPPSPLDPLQILRSIQKANSIPMDRFDLEINRLYYRIPLRRQMVSSKTLYVYSYLSVGVDALVTYNFHKTRESRFYVLSNRIFNKLLYLCFGTQQLVLRDCEGLQNKIDLYLDEQLIELPDLQSIVFLNIDSWGAGCKLCALSNREEEYCVDNNISDGRMEVFGIVSSFHIAQLQVGLGKPIRLGQAKQIRIRLKSTCPIQVDGEPWIQQPAELRLKSRSQVRMLTK